MASCFWTTVPAMMMMTMMIASPGDSSEPKTTREPPTPYSIPYTLHEAAQGRNNLVQWNDRDDVFDLGQYFIKCTGNNEFDLLCEIATNYLIRNNIQPPAISEIDNCYDAGFHKEECLRKIVSGLYAFEPYVTYIREGTNMGAILWGRLYFMAIMFQHMMDNPDTVTMPVKENMDAILVILRKQTNLQELVSKHIIRQRLIDFMTISIIAVRHIIGI